MEKERDFQDLTVEDILDMSAEVYGRFLPLPPDEVSKWRESTRREITPEKLAMFRRWGRDVFRRDAEHCAKILAILISPLSAPRAN